MIKWDLIRDTTMAYRQRKKDEHRFDGQGKFDVQKAAMYDLIKGKELIP